LIDRSCDNNVTVSITPFTGHCYKLCPFSFDFYDGWDVDTGAVASGTLSNVGNSKKFPYGGRESGVVTYSDEYTMFGDAVYDTHPYTDGKMITKSRGGGGIGWMCMDDNCPHFVQTGTRFFET